MRPCSVRSLLEYSVFSFSHLSAKGITGIYFRSRDIKTSFFPTSWVPTTQVNVIPVLQRPFIPSRSDQGLHFPGLWQADLLSWLRPCWGLRLPSIQPVACVGQDCRQTHFCRSAPEDKWQRMKGIGLFGLPFLLCPLPLPPVSNGPWEVFLLWDSDGVFLKSYFGIDWSPSKFGEGCIPSPSWCFPCKFTFEDHGSLVVKWPDKLAAVYPGGSQWVQDAGELQDPVLLCYSPGPPHPLNEVQMQPGE